MNQRHQDSRQGRCCTTKAVGKVTGMGMAISYQLITEKHNGKIECFSDEGVGTEFIIEIPLRLED